MIESSSAISLSSPLNKKQAKRLLAVDKKCRKYRSIEMKKRNKVTQEILRKSMSGRTLNGNYLPTTLHGIELMKLLRGGVIIFNYEPNL